MSVMKNSILFGLVLAVIFTGCGKKEAPPVVVEEPESAVKRTLEVALEKAGEFKETAGEALGKATDRVMSFKDRAFDAIKKTPATSED